MRFPAHSASSRLRSLSLLFPALSAASAQLSSHSPPSPRSTHLCSLQGLDTGVTFMWWEKGFPFYLTWLLSVFVPPFNLAKLLGDAAEITRPLPELDAAGATVFFQAARQFEWADLGSYAPNRSAVITYDPLASSPDGAWFVTPAPVTAILLLVLSTLLYAGLAWYTAQIFTGGDARSQPYSFPLSSDYWRGAARDAAGALLAVKTAMRERLAKADAVTTQRGSNQRASHMHPLRSPFCSLLLACHSLLTGRPLIEPLA